MAFLTLINLQSWYSWIGNVSILLVTIVSLSLLIIGVHRLVFHPLAKYPGPFLAKLTDLYSAYHAWKGDIHLDIYQCHQKYGDHVRYAPNRVIINTAGALQDIYGHRAKVKKGSTYKFLAQQAPNTLTLTDKALHGSRRRVLSQAFAESSLRLFEPKILSKLDKFSAAMRGVGWNCPVDMAKAFNYLAFDMMTDIIFNLDFNTMGDEKYRYAMQAVEESNIRLGVLLQAAGLSVGGLDRKLFPKSILASRQFVRFLRILLKERLQSAKSTNSKDIFSFLEQCKDPNTGNGLNQTELSTETATFVVAGSDTTSTTLAALSHYLTGSSTWYRKATEEVRSTFSSVEEIRLGPKLNSCTTLRACLDESLRLSPPGGSSLWREVERGGAVIDGEFIPEGCDVGVGVYSIHHDSRYYPNAFTYNPERWLHHEGDKGDRARQPYMPFSIGSRSCVGKPLAIAQVMLTFARLLWEFDMRRAINDELWADKEIIPLEYALKDHVSASKEGPLLCFRPRTAPIDS